MKKSDLLLLALLMFTLQACSLFTPAGISPSPTDTLQPSTARPQVSITPGSSAIYLPNGDYVIRVFFLLISSGRDSDAMELLDKSLFSDPATKQAWSEPYKSIASLEVVSLEPWEQTSWQNNQQTYRVVLNVQLKPGLASSGWAKGQNTRWVTLTRDPTLKLWRIHSIASHP